MIWIVLDNQSWFSSFVWWSPDDHPPISPTGFFFLLRKNFEHVSLYTFFRVKTFGMTSNSALSKLFAFSPCRLELQAAFKYESCNWVSWSEATHRQYPIFCFYVLSAKREASDSHTHNLRLIKMALLQTAFSTERKEIPWGVKEGSSCLKAALAKLIYNWSGCNSGLMASSIDALLWLEIYPQCMIRGLNQGGIDFYKWS